MHVPFNTSFSPQIALMLFFSYLLASKIWILPCLCSLFTSFYRRLEVKHLEKRRRRALCCAGCGIGVAWEGDVFTLPGAEGVVGAYVNPLGYVHQVGRIRGGRGGACF